MKKKQTYKRIAAWMLVFSMIFGSNSSVVFADGLTAENTASAAETAVSAAEEVPAVGEQGTLENLAAPAAVSDENGQAVLTEIPADDAPEEVIPGAAEEVLTDEFLPDGELSGAENGEFAVDGKLSAAENEEPAAAEELSEAGNGESAEDESAAGGDDILFDESGFIEEIVLADDPALASEEAPAEEQPVEPYVGYNYQYDPYNNTVLSGDDFYLGGWVDYELENEICPDGWYDRIPITDVRIEEQSFEDENGGPLEFTSTAQPDGNDNWYLTTPENGFGTITFRIGHAKIDPVSFDPETFDPETAEMMYSDLLTAYVGVESYRLDFAYPNLWNDYMPVNGEMTIQTSLYRRRLGAEDEDISDYTLTVTTEDTGTLTVTPEGTAIKISSGEEEDWREIEVTATLPGESELVAANTFTVCVRSEGYYAVRLENMDEIENLAPGGSVEVNPQLWHVSGDGTETMEENAWYSWDFDSGCLQVKDSEGKELENTEDGETAIGRAPFTVTKLTNDGTNAWLQAKLPDEEGGYYDADGGGADLYFGGRNCDVWFKDLRYGELSTWMYSDADTRLELDVSNLEGMDYAINWQVGDWEEVEPDNWQITNPLDPAEGYYEADNTGITLHGGRLAEVYQPGTENNQFHVQAQVIPTGTYEPVFDTMANVEMSEFRAEYNYQYDPYNSTALSGDNFYLGIWVDYELENEIYPYGWNDSIPITDVRIEEQSFEDENGSPLEFTSTAQPDENGNWYLTTPENGFGTITFRIGHAKVDPVSFDPETFNPETAEMMYSELMTVYVGGEFYRLDFAYPNLWNDYMPVNDEMTIQTSLYHRSLGAEDEDISDYTLTVTTEDTGTLTVTPEGTAIKISSGEEEDWREIEVTATLPGESELVAANTFTVCVRSEGYYAVRLENMDEIENLAPGGSVEVNPQLWHVSGDGTETMEENVRYFWDFDSGCLQVKDSEGKELENTEDEETAIGRAPFTVTKLTNDDTNAWLQAKLPDEEGGYYDADGGNADLYFGSRNCDIWFMNLRWDEWSTWMYSDADTRLELDVSNLEGMDYTINWQVGDWEEVEPDNWQITNPLDPAEGYYEADNTGITLHGGKLAEVYQPGTENNQFHVQAQVIPNGADEPVFDVGADVDMRESWMYFEGPLYWPSGRDMLLQAENSFDTVVGGGYELENEQFPYRNWYDVEVTNVEVTESWRYGENGEDIPADESTPIVTVEKSEDGQRWIIHSYDTYGYAILKLDYTLTPDPESHPDYVISGSDEEFRVNVNGDIYSLNYTDPKNVSQMFSGETKIIETTLRHDWQEWIEDDPETGDGHFEFRSENVEDYTLRVTDDENEPMYDPETVTVTPDGRSLIIKANPDPEYAGRGCNIHVEAYVPDEEAGEWNVAFNDIYTETTDWYWTLMPGTLENFEELDLSNIRLIEYSKDNPDGAEVEDAVVRVEWYDENLWSVKKGSDDLLPTLIRRGADDGTNITVIAESKDGEEWYRRDYWFNTVCELRDSWEEIEVIKEPTCTEDGLKIYECTECFLRRAEVIPALGHTEVTERTEPTCTEAGREETKCTVCGEVLSTEEIPPTGHKEGTPEVTKEATCTEAGEKTVKCTVCNEVIRTEPIPATGHKEGTPEVTKAATCTEAGEKTVKCTVCNEVVRTEPIPAVGHKEGTPEVTKAATCAAAGEKTVKCTVCGQVIRTEEIPATGEHTWGAWTKVSEADVFKAATQSRTCSVCGKTEVQDSGSKLEPVLELTAKSLKMETKQSTTKFGVTEMAKGDSVASVKSSNTKLLKVSSVDKVNGTFKLKAQKKSGTARLTVTLESGISKTVKVKIRDAKVETAKITVASKKISLKKGKSYALKPVVTPVTSQDKITFSSSKESVATVNAKGVIKAKKKGKAKITIQSGKKKVVCTVTVK